MRNLQTFDHGEIFGMNITAFGTRNKPLFLAEIIAGWLGHSDVSAMLENVDDDEKFLRPLDGENTESWFLTEGGVYEVVMLSQTAIAKGFKKGMKELLHSVRTGHGVMQMPLHGYDAVPAIMSMLRKHIAAG
jgi:prophage antirepressor-like protein